MVSMIFFLRGAKSGIENRTGVLNHQHKEYFKATPYPLLVKLFRCLIIVSHCRCCVFPGSAAMDVLLSSTYNKFFKNALKITTEAEAMALLQQTLPYTFYLRVDRQQAQSSSTWLLFFFQQQMFSPDGYFVWFYKRPQRYDHPADDEKG